MGVDEPRARATQRRDARPRWFKAVDGPTLASFGGRGVI